MLEFIYPEKPKRIYSLEIVPKDYNFQIKKDGHRAIIIIEDGVRIYNRHKNILNASKNFDWNWLSKIFPNGTILDGELVGARQAGELNDTIVIWDMPFHNDLSLLNKPYKFRKDMLQAYISKNDIKSAKSFGTSFIEKNNNTELYLSNDYELKDFEKYWKQLDKNFDEGIVFKNPDAKLSWSYTSTQTTINQLKLLAK